MSQAAIWQEIEFGPYSADLPLWLELAEAAAGPVLELGAGAGRVALHLAANGFEVIALERDRELAAELKRRGAGSVTVVEADLAGLDRARLPSPPALVIAPLHMLQELDPRSRRDALVSLRAVMAPGAILAATLVDESTLLSEGLSTGRILPDMRELDGWVYSSEPLWVQVGEDALRVRRLREVVAPDGEKTRSVHDEVLHRLPVDLLEREATEAGFVAIGTRAIRSGPSEADSIAVLLEAR
jgi:SAM-dependent methyltransferase